jgi:probable HAF family extracellular repeat protein
MKDLGTVGDDGCSEALEVSAKDQILGQSLSCDGSTAPAFIWENGSMIDLNTFDSTHLKSAPGVCGQYQRSI